MIKNELDQLFANDFNFDSLEESLEARYEIIDVCGMVIKAKSKEKIFVDFENERKQLEYLCEKLPNSNQVIKALSTKGGFSALSFILWITNTEKIEELWISTFRIGKKHFQKLEELYENNKIEKLYLITSDSQERIDSLAQYKDSTYNYFQHIKEISEKNNWKIAIFNNHSKIVLAKTKDNFYVLETSSNMNENPKCEQFSFENDKSLYDFYKNFLEEIFNENSTN